MVGRLPFLGRRGAILATLLLAPAMLGDAMPAVAQEPPPVNIVVIGDSLGESVWASLYWRFYSTREVRVVNAAKASTGFNRTPYEELLDLPDGQKPQLAVVMTGANDAQNVWPLQEGGTPGVFGTAAWATLYRQRMERFFEAAEERGVTLIWIGMPIMRDAGFEARMSLVREVQREACAAHGVTYLDLVPASVDAAGAYTDTKTDDSGRVRTFRADDGVHLSIYGSNRIAEIVLFALLEVKPPWMDTPREKLFRAALG
ncbi:MAG: DUF459 domain-containing protein [Reyranellaceae bacterium]